MLFRSIHPQVGKTLFDQVGKLTSVYEKATCIWLFMRERSQQKAEVAQALTRRIIDRRILIRNADGSFEDIDSNGDFVVPEYIQNSIFSVTKEKIDG